ncbi:hypothetical protein M1145_02645 [Patescibacteria group bacterium]|nr:hypothetical protein [Patescibacteria group bacterium]
MSSTNKNYIDEISLFSKNEFRGKDVFSKFKNYTDENNKVLQLRSFYKSPTIIFLAFTTFIVLIIDLILFFKYCINLSSKLNIPIYNHSNVVFTNFSILEILIILIILSAVSFYLSFKTYVNILYVSLFILTFNVFINMIFLITFYKFLQITI